MEYKLRNKEIIFLGVLLFNTFFNIDVGWGNGVVEYVEGDMYIHNVLLLNSFAKDVKLMIEGIMNNSYQSAFFYSISGGKVIINESDYGTLYIFTYPSLSPGRVILDAYGHFISQGIRTPSEGRVNEMFLEPTSHIQSDNVRIKELAKTIVEGEEDDTYKVMRIVEWIRNNLKYDESYADKNYDALTVLNLRRGVCAEYTTLFVAFMRSLGIPARYASGYAYNDNMWERHAYAEVYINGRWMPVDVLWGEVGFVDASHLLFSYSKDNQPSDSLQINVYGEGEARWIEDSYYFNHSRLVRSNLTHLDIRVISNYEEGKGIREGSWGAFIVHINNPYNFDYMENISIFPCLGSSLKFDEMYKLIWLRKGDNYVVFPFYIEGSLREGYKVECPVVISSMFGESKVKTIEYYSPFHSLSLSENDEMGGWNVTYTPVIGYDDSNMVYINDGGEYFVVSPYSMEVIRGREVEVKPYKLGRNTFYLISNSGRSKGEVRKIQFNVKKYSYLQSINIPTPVFTGEVNITLVFFNHSKGKKVRIVVRDERGRERYDVHELIEWDKVNISIPVFTRTTIEVYVLGRGGVIEKHVKDIRAWDKLVVRGREIIKDMNGIRVREVVNNTALYNLSIDCYSKEKSYRVDCYLNVSPTYIDVFIPSISFGDYYINMSYIYKGKEMNEIVNVHLSFYESAKLYVERWIKHLEHIIFKRSV